MRLIDADALIKEAMKSSNYFIIKYAVQKAPTIDAEPVVRCKDCVSFHYSGMGGDNGITYCAKGIEMQPTDFCSYGEREDDEER